MYKVIMEIYIIICSITRAIWFVEYLNICKNFTGIGVSERARKEE